jgi:hypothetical protein
MQSRPAEQTEEERIAEQLEEDQIYRTKKDW